MKTHNYDFSSLNSVFYEGLKKQDLNFSDLNTIKRELNKFFKDSTCSSVYFTNNISKPFFGMIVCPSINGDDIYDYLMGNDEIRLAKYTVEIDSHLFNPVLGLDEKEITAVLLHEIGHVVNDCVPIMNARRYLDEYMAKNHSTLRMSDSIHYKEVLSYALKDFVAKDRSIFYTSDVDEVMADDFVRGYGYGLYLEHALQKILKNNSKLYQGQYNDRFTTFIWTMDLYNHMQYRRVPALRFLRKVKALTGSRIEQAEIENLMRRINRIDDNSLLEAGPISAINSKIKQRMKKMRIDNMKSLEDDYYEINMRIRNVEDEEDALYLMRQINTRISLITDFIETGDLDSVEKRKWNDVLDRFGRLREELSNSMVYKRKNYGIFVQYPDIVADRY